MTSPPARRILMTTDAVGGVWSFATDLASALCNCGHTVILAVMGPAPRAEQLKALRAVPGLQVELTGTALEWMDPEDRDASWARKSLLGIASRADLDLVHLNSYREASFDWPAPVLVVAHSCVWSWWQACRGEAPTETRWDTYAAAVQAGLAAADAWVAPTRAFRDCIAAHYAPRSHGHVIRNGISLPIGGAKKEPFILAAGRLWDEAKNLAAVGGVASELDWPVRVAGPMQSPGADAAHPGIDGIECLGTLSRSQLIAEMRRAAIFVSPALYEPFGLSILEAASCGCALVLSDIPTLRELWDGAAQFVEPHDRGALVRSLQDLCRDHELRARMQQAARRRAERYRLSETVTSYAELYRAISDPRASKRAASSSAAMAEAAA